MFTGLEVEILGFVLETEFLQDDSDFLLFNVNRLSNKISKGAHPAVRASLVRVESDHVLSVMDVGG